jgi:phosphate:Na+ symporter
MTFDSFINDNAETATHIEPLEQVIDKLQKQLKALHVSRLQSGECTIELGFIHSDLLTNYERISDHCSNIAVYTMQLSSDMLDAHKYLNKIKNATAGAFVDDYDMFEKKYSL